MTCSTPIGPRAVVVAAVAAGVFAVASGCAWFGSGRSLPDSPAIDDAHRNHIIEATAASEADIQTARTLLGEDRIVDSLNLLIDRIKFVQTLLYDEYILKSQAYDAMDLRTALGYDDLINELRRAEDGLVQSLNEPLNKILNEILLQNPDPRRREEAVDAIDGGANEIFIQFKTGYREEIVRSFRVRLRSERNVAVRGKMAGVLSKLSTGQGELEATEAAFEN